MADKMIKGYPAVPGNKRIGIISHTGPASYPTAGETIYASAFGLKYVEFVAATGSDPSGTYVCEPVLFGSGQDGVSSFKLVWRTRTTGAEVANTTDVHASTVRLMAIGIG